jgi:hypothetical protein
MIAATAKGEITMVRITKEMIMTIRITTLDKDLSIASLATNAPLRIQTKALVVIILKEISIMLVH